MKRFFTSFSGMVIFICLITTSYAQTDTIPPVVLDFKADLTAVQLSDSVDAVFTLTYSEEVQLIDTFSIVTHYLSNNVWTEYDRYDTTEIVVEGSTITVTPKKSFWSSGRYEFIVISGAVQDMSGNSARSFTRTFVADEDAPQVTDLHIEFTENELNDSVSAVFTLTYNENIQLSDTFTLAAHVDENGIWPEYVRYSPSEITVQDSVLTITAARKFSTSKRYELVVAWGAVSDLAGNLATSFTRVFTPDVTPPEVVELETVFTDTEFADSTNVSFMLTYNEDVKLAPTYQFVTHYRNAGTWESYEIIADTGIVVAGNTITLKPAFRYSASGTYELVVASGSVRDLVDNPAGSFTKVFQVDSIPPKLVEISPDLSQPVATNAVFTFTFDETVRLSNNFGFYTYAWNDDSAKYIQVERLTASEATVNGNVVVFDPNLNFMPSTRTQIVLTAGSVLDMEGNRFINLTGADTVTYVSERFWTADSGVMVVSFLPADDDSISVIPEALTITFSEKIMAADTTASDSFNISQFVYLKQNELDVEHIAVLDSAARKITIEPVADLSYGTTYTYGFISGLATEEGDSIPAAEASFTILDSMNVVNDYAIAEINGDSAASPYLGQDVRITGTITGVYVGEGFYVQDENAAGSGIWVQHTDTLELQVGDGVTITGTVINLNGVTSIDAGKVTIVPAPLTIEPVVINFGTDSIPMYRGVLIQIVDAPASAANNEGEWNLYVSENTDSVTIGNWFYGYTPVLDNLYNLTGIVTFRDSLYRIEPRFEADITDVTAPTSAGITPDTDFTVYPNPFGSYIRINNSDKLTRVIISNIAGQRVLDINNPEAEINTSHLINGVYIINLFNDKSLVKSGRLIKH